MKVRPWDKSHPQNFFGPAPEKRIEMLEERLEQLERFLRERFPSEFESAMRELENSQADGQKARRGPKPRVSEEHLFIRRDSLILFLEPNWPELREIFRKPVREDAVRKVLTEMTDSRYGHHAPRAQELLGKQTELIEVLRSDDYNGDPRMIANAMAGVPEIAWSTSLKRCRANPSELAVHERALRDYLNRNFHSAYVRLLNARSTEEIRNVLQSVKSQDREFNWIRDNPEDVPKILERGTVKRWCR